MGAGFALALVGAACSRHPASNTPPRIVAHAVVVDENRKLLSWAARAPYATVARLAFTALETKFPIQDNGVETWLTFSRFDPDTFEGIAWPHNPAGLYAMLVDSAIRWRAFSGDRAAIDVARKALDHQLAHGTTPEDWDWARVPYASAAAGAVDYGGADDAWCDYCGRGDGIGVIEPDKVGELGFAYLQAFESTGEARYRDAAVACADALARHVGPGDRQSSPWPFRVYALTNVVREPYSSNVIGAIELFDELQRLEVGNVEAYARARAMAFNWLMSVPMTTDAWSAYFEDIDIQSDPAVNVNQYSALRTARWLVAHPDADPDWRGHVLHLLTWAVERFGADTATERGVQWGATVMSEQMADMAKMASHTARLGATLALFSEVTGDAAIRDRAARSLNWATYACREDGVVAVGESANEGYWFSDGYGDYIRHFLVAMAAVPDWAPSGENHLLSSTSVVSDVTYERDRIAWTTFDQDSTESVRLASEVAAVYVDAVRIAPRQELDDEGYLVQPLRTGGTLLRVRHRRARAVAVTLGGR